MELPLCETLSCRRLLPTDAAALAALSPTFFAPPRRPDPAMPASVFRLGEARGVFAGKALAAAAAVLPLDAPEPLCAAAAAALPLAGLRDAKTTALALPLPPAAGCARGGAALALLLAGLPDFGPAAGRALLCSLPARAAVGLGPQFPPQALFDAGFVLRALRPLYRLSASLVFVLAPDAQTLYNKGEKSAGGTPLRLPAAETRQLGRLLEDGRTGIGFDGGCWLLV